MAGGRPTDYSESVLKKARQYLTNCQDEAVQEVVGLSAKGTELYKNKLKVKLPSIEGLAGYLRVARSTVYKWAEEHPEFSDILESVLQEQHDRLLNNGLSGDYNPTITKLVLTKHGYSDKTELTGKDGKDLIPQPILSNMNGLSDNQRNAEDSGAN